MNSLLSEYKDKRLPKFTSVGCYPLFYLDKASNVLCAGCATEARDDLDWPDDAPTDMDVNWEDPNLFCDCGERIESAYGEEANNDSE